MMVSMQGRDPGNVGGLSQRIAEIFPAREAALQRTHARDAQFLKLLCHTGTGCFIGSSTVEDDLLVFRQHVRAFGDFIGQNANGAGQSPWIGDGIKGMAKIQDHHFFS
jgi:hypothetical protein